MLLLTERSPATTWQLDDPSAGITTPIVEASGRTVQAGGSGLVEQGQAGHATSRGCTMAAAQTTDNASDQKIGGYNWEKGSSQK